MVAGGAAIIPKSIFDPVRPLTAAIASEMGEVSVEVYIIQLIHCRSYLINNFFYFTLISKQL